MNTSCSRYGTHDFRSVIDDIISSTKTGGQQHIEEKICIENIPVYFRSGVEELCHSVV